MALYSIISYCTGIRIRIFFHTDLMIKKIRLWTLHRPDLIDRGRASWNLQNCPHMHDERSVAITDEDLKSVYLLTLILCALNSAKMCCVTNHSRSLIGLLYLKMFFQKMNFFHASTQNHFCSTVSVVAAH